MMFTMDAAFTLPGFISAAPRSRIAAGLLVADVALGTGNALMSHFFAASMRNGAVNGDPGSVLASAGLVMLLSMASFVVMVLTVVYYCLWLHRAFTNLQPLQV